MTWLQFAILQFFSNYLLFLPFQNVQDRAITQLKRSRAYGVFFLLALYMCREKKREGKKRTVPDGNALHYNDWEVLDG